MSRSGRVVVLCEDKRTQQFLRGFLKKLSYKPHELRFAAIPAGRGSGEQQVRKQYPVEMAALRRIRSRFPDQVLVVAIDADRETVEARYRQLEQCLRDAKLQERGGNERVCVLVPRRNIETWIRVLCGEAASEDDDYAAPPSVRRETGLGQRTDDAAAAFFQGTRPNAALWEPCVPSLERAVPEAQRVPKADQ